MISDVMMFIFGAVAGVLWPPKSAGWARAQRVGLIFGLSAVISLAAAFFVVYFDGWTAAAAWALGLGCALMLCFGAVGTACRLAHEKSSKKSVPH